MERKNIFDDSGRAGKRLSFAILLAVCVLVIGIAGFLSYRSIKGAMDGRTAKDEQDVGVTEEKTEPVQKPAENVKKEPVTQETPVKQATETHAETPPPVENKSYVMPVDGEVTVGFSLENPVYSTTLKDWRIHDGIDIAAGVGSSVIAVNDGVVESIDKDDLYGVVVVIKHTDGRKSKYAGLEDSVELEVGQIINRGDRVGAVGNTSIFEMSDGPHVHFEMSENGEKIDPALIIKK